VLGTQGLPLPETRSVSFFCLTRAELGKWRAARDSNPQPPDP
jgi:hypothetical protein